MASSTLPDQTTNTAAPKPTYFTRFNIWQRIEHVALLVSFTTLALTGLPQKFADAPISDAIIGLLGGIEATRGLHHFAAIVLMALSVYHLLAVIYRIVVKRSALSMFPVLGDFKHLIQDILFYLGKRKHRAYYGRYSYAEKVEYLAVVWGTLVMIITGFMMWNPIATTNSLPGEVIPAAKVAHGGEAVLAVLAIILWHFYNVHIRHFNKSMFTGKLTREEMEYEHPAELAVLEAGQDSRTPSPAVLQRRQRIFYPIAAVVAIGLSFGLFKFITFEQTSILTMPPGETARVFAPQTPTPSPTRKPTSTPTATPTPGAATSTPAPGGGTSTVTWTGGIDQIIAAKCGACHVSTALGGLSMKTYADAMKGGKDGAVIVPGDPDKSLLIQIQSKGGHPGQLSADELATVTAWIKAGAPETGGTLPAVPTPGASVSSEAWTGGIDQIIGAKCSACHIQSQTAGLSLKTYADALKGGNSGPAVVPGDSDKSLLVQVQSKGGHPGQLSTDELARIVAWIKAGAPEISGTSAAPTPGVSSSLIAWTGGIDQLISAKCSACHIQSQTAGLSLKTYADALKGGNSGPAIVPGNVDKSLLIQIQSKGGHPGQWSTDELATVTAWIKAGAPETSGTSATPPSFSSTDSWTDGFDQIFAAKCGECHIQSQAGNLSLKTYGDALKGGKDGPVIVPGNPASSLIIQIQSRGGHPGQLSLDELGRLVVWIRTATLPLNESSSVTPTPNASSSSSTVWTGGIDQLISAKCSACHIQSQAAGLSLKTYADALKGGKGGPAIVPGNADKSLLVQVQSKGGHPGQLSTDELAQIIAWIKAGAPEK